MMNHHNNQREYDMTNDQNDNDNQSARAQPKRTLDLSRFAIPLPAAIASNMGTSQRRPMSIPKDYQVSSCDVVCGRGRAHCKREGNMRFRQIVNKHVQDYQSAKTKVEKAAVLSTIVDEVQSRDPSTGICGRFVKQMDDGSWIELGETAAREKAGHAIREAVSLLEKAKRRSPPKRTQSFNDEKRQKIMAESIQNQMSESHFMNRSWPFLAVQEDEAGERSTDSFRPMEPTSQVDISLANAPWQNAGMQTLEQDSSFYLQSDLAFDPRLSARDDPEPFAPSSSQQDEPAHEDFFGKTFFSLPDDQGNSSHF